MLKPAIKFGLFYGFILVLSNFLDFYLGSKGIFIAALISGIADVDAITIFVTRHATLGPIAVASIVIACLVNTIVKIMIALIFLENL